MRLSQRQKEVLVLLTKTPGLCQMQVRRMVWAPSRKVGWSSSGGRDSACSSCLQTLERRGLIGYSKEKDGWVLTDAGKKVVEERGLW